MQCKTCGYALWNLRTRHCPECGDAFIPSDFEFEPNSVQYCCTSCGQAYFGTDEQGHLTPVAFNCVKCGTPQRMDDMVLLPARGLTDRHTRLYRLPWLERERIGTFRAWYRTVIASFIKPAEMMRAVPSGTSAASGWGFFFINHLMLGLIVGAISAVIYLIAIALVLWGAVGGSPRATGAFLGCGIGAGVLILMTIVVNSLFTLLWAATAHGVIRLSGPRHGGFGLTSQAFTFTSGTLAFVLTMCISQFAYIWWMVSATIALKEVQRVSWMRAVLASLLFPFVFGIVVAAVYVGFIFFSLNQAMTTANANAGQMAAATVLDMQPVLDLLAAYEDNHDGAFPPHALAMVTTDDLHSPDVFVSANGLTDAWRVPLGTGTLFDFIRAAPVEREAIAAAEAAALPDDVVAHRVGDFVFTYHGIDRSTMSPHLWVVIEAMDPDSNVGTSGTGQMMYVCGMVDGSSITMIRPQFEGSLGAQNAMRLREGLPALPHPDTVTHYAPGRPWDATQPAAPDQSPDPLPEQLLDPSSSS